jgi:hypothetical protein
MKRSAAVSRFSSQVATCTSVKRCAQQMSIRTRKDIAFVPIEQGNNECK